MSFLGEIKRRKAFQVAATYLLVAWLILQVVDVIADPLQLPESFPTVIIVLLAIGFPITLVLSWAFNLTPEGVVRDRGGAVAAQTGRRMEYVLLALLTLALGWIGYREFVPSGRSESQILPNSVAVLLCDNLSPDPDDAYFAASLHEEILNQLVKLRNLNVIARTSVLQYAGAARPIPEIAEELGVESVMECSVSYADNRVAISAQLIEGESGVHLWSERYNREFRDVFGIQSDVAINVASALRVTLSQEEQVEMERIPTNSPEAYTLYLRSTDFEIEATQRLAMLDEALSIDPQFSLAYSEKAEIYAGLFVDAFTQNAASASEQEDIDSLVRQNVAQALALDPALGEAYLAQGLADMYTWRWADARDAFERAVAASPNDSEILWWYSWFRSFSGNHSLAVEYGRRAVALDPGNIDIRGALGLVLWRARRPEEAIETLQIANNMLLSPQLLLWLGQVEGILGNESEAYELLQRSEALFGDRPSTVVLAIMAYGYAQIGRRSDVERLFAALEGAAEENVVGTGSWALAYLALGDYDQALVWLRAAVEKIERNEPDAGFFHLTAIKANPNADPVLEEPRFTELLDRIASED